MLGFYLHDLNPEAIRITDAFIIRWYGLSYVLGFTLTYFLLRRLIRRGLCAIKEEGLLTFVVLGALAVIASARLGYMLLYALDQGKLNIVEAIQPQKGGLSAHGAIGGILLYCASYARWHRLSWAAVLDNVAATAPLGIFGGRLGNFVNGELFGRVTEVPWAVKFPTELLHEDYVRQGGQSVTLPSGARSSPEIIAFFEQNGGGRLQLEAMLHPRHPSQVYEALAEGFLLFALLYHIRVRFPRLPQGILAGTFFLGYAVARISLESFRQPDSGSDPILGLTKGQFYSAFMIGIGAALIIYAVWQNRSRIPATPG